MAETRQEAMRLTLKARECGTENMSTWRFRPFLDVLSAFLSFCGRLLVFYRDTALERVKRCIRQDTRHVAEKVKPNKSEKWKKL